jgi:tetratricopeptide (TPR) repeat protein
MTENPENFEKDNKNFSVKRFEEMLKKSATYFFDVEEFENIIDYYLDHSNIKKADQVVEYAQSVHPGSVVLMLKSAQVNGSNGKLIKALDILKQIEAVEPFNPEVYLTKAGVLRQLRDHKGAIKCFKEALKYIDEEEDDIYVDMAFEQEHISDYDGAIESLKKALEINSENEAALYEITYCFDIGGKANECVDYLNQFLDENPYAFIGWYNLGNTYFKLEEFEKSIEAFEFCNAIKEDFSSAYFNKANAYVQIAKYHEAIEAYKYTLENETPMPVTYGYIGECYEKIEDFELSEIYYNKALAIDENYADAYVGLGVINELQKRFAVALNFYQKALELEPENSDYWYVYAEGLCNAGYKDEALKTYKYMIAEFDQEVDTWLDYADLILEMESSVPALLIIDGALEIFPKNSELLYRRAAYLIMMGKLKEAYINLETALEQDFDIHTDFIEYYPEALKINNILKLIELYKNK